MNNLQINGITELNSKEMIEVEGGIIPLLALAVEVACYAAAGDIMLNFDEYCEALESKISGCN